MKDISLLIMFTVCTLTMQAQQSHAVSIIDFVKIKEGKTAEALYFYENNWKLYRNIALGKGFIKGYKMLTTKADSIANFDLVLVTEYTDSSQYNQAEARFNDIIKQERPNGPKLLNGLKPNEFRQNMFTKRVEEE